MKIAFQVQCRFLSYTKGLLLIFAISLICQSCYQNSGNKKAIGSNDSISKRISKTILPDKKSDSVSLRNKLISIYKWYRQNEHINHNNFLTSQGIDTIKLESAIDEMSKTNFFSIDFLTNYRKIAQRTNKAIKVDSTLLMAGIAFPFQEFDTWHGGQGSQPNLNELAMLNLSVDHDFASFKWTTTNWDSVNVRFNRDKDHWKLSYIELLDLRMY